MYPILLVDDEEGLLDMLKIMLQKEGIIDIDIAATGKQALEKINNVDYSLIVLDIMLPDIDGFQICQEIRKKSDVPILFISARTSDIDKLTGLNIGGDDYITKPFNPLEVVARIKIHMRRHNLQLQSQNKLLNQDQYDYGYFSLSKKTGELFVNGKSIICPAKEFELLSFFCANPNQVFSAEQLYEKIWQQSTGLNDRNTVMVHILRLRKKIEEDVKKPKIIVNIRSIGYKFIPPKMGDI
ncbi:response regulator transcription factor [Lysinibacillus mangiferihumi]|uniref:Response regulator transcription factor n=1 Tax=Lysinibacillus mangiferihumi TaxID=1130819 RepID=A0A4U2Y1G1_9BACI|nr:response regulator transcription factor [Lysinibacillus mangiferihumi]TKI53362.1 response regulator transcription factor [Lysinibacillus mangiferihumi]